MKVLFVFKSDFNAVPLGLMTLSAILKKNGHECDFIDLKFEYNYINEIKKINPDILAYTIVSFTWKFYQKTNIEIRKHHNAFSIFGGPHCSIYPDFIYEEGVDAICIGEGENAMLELVELLSRGRDITKINNLWIKKDGIILKNEVRNLIEDLDSIPFPDQELISKYHFFRKIGICYIMTSRGCPYNCPYCINHFYRNLYLNKGRYVRRRTVQNVIEELLILKNQYKTKLIVFNDDIFTLDKPWLMEFAIEYKKLINLPCEVYARVNEVDEQIIGLLKDMGCIAAYIGIESGNEKLRYEVLKRKFDNDAIINTSLLFRKNGIKIMAFNILNLPDETLENAFETLYLNAKSKITYPQSFIFQPFPNMELTKYSQEKGYYNGDMNNYNKSLAMGKSQIISKDSKKIERLHYLFIIGARMPFTIPLIKTLIKIPFNTFYKFLLFMSRTYILIFVLYKPYVPAILMYYLKLPLKFLKIPSLK